MRISVNLLAGNKEFVNCTKRYTKNTVNQLQQPVLVLC